MKIVTNSRLFILPLLRNYSAIAVGSYCLVKDEVVSDRLLGHELVHYLQMKRHGTWSFYIFYLRDYCRNLLRYRNHDKAYQAIPFEREAYARELDTDVQILVSEIKRKHELS